MDAAAKQLAEMEAISAQVGVVMEERAAAEARAIEAERHIDHHASEAEEKIAQVRIDSNSSDQIPKKVSVSKPDKTTHSRDLRPRPSQNIERKHSHTSGCTHVVRRTT